MSALVSAAKRGSPASAIERVRTILDAYDAAASQTLADAQVASWVASTAAVTRSLPRAIVDELVAPRGVPSSVKAREIKALRKEVPLAADAVEWLLTRRVVTPGEVASLSASAQREAISVAGVDSLETMVKLQGVLADSMLAGDSIASFRRRLEAELGESALDARHVETVHRTVVQTAYAEGRRRMEGDPVVAATFPYKEYLPIRDGRARQEHKDLGVLGLDGTGVYRADDPMWEMFDPPWDWNCRCGANLLTLRKAASKGVREAQRWLDTGVAPEAPTWRVNEIPFGPNPAFTRSAA